MSQGKVERRSFLKYAAATAGFSVLPAQTVFGAEANAKLKLGVIGCGGRGSWIGDLFQKHGNAKVTAVHDYFRDRVDAAGDKLDVPKAQRYVGLDGYKELLASGVDAVAIESPPYFHPEQAVAALEAGKHVYLAKPIAVDAPGCLAIVEAAKKAKGQCCLVDFQTRANPFFQGAAERIQQGIIGKLTMGHVFYHTGRLGIQAKPGTETARLRNWVFDIPLSGDIIVEQNIHVMDVSNWFMNAHPVKASGTGGRKVRVDVGDCWDHFIVTYTYPDGSLVDFSSRQFGDGFDDLCIRMYGETGTVDAHYGGDVKIRGSKAGWAGGNTADIYKAGAVTNIERFAAAIAAGTPINNAEESANSTMTMVMGRMAAYSGNPVTWDEMLAANEKLDPKLNLPADGPDSTETA